MKKLVFLAAAALAFCANAAQCSWGVDTINDPSSGDASDGFLVYFFATEGLSNDEAGRATTVEAANTALASKDATTINAFLAKGWEADMTTDSGYSEGSIPDVFKNGSAISGYLVVFNADSVSDATYAFVSGIESGLTGELGQSGDIQFGDLDDTASLENWTSIAGSSPTPGVPEPTSGLLLVVGGALMALRRRR